MKRLTQWVCDRGCSPARGFEGDGMIYLPQDNGQFQHYIREPYARLAAIEDALGEEYDLEDIRRKRQ